MDLAVPDGSDGDGYGAIVPRQAMLGRSGEVEVRDALSGELLSTVTYELPLQPKALLATDVDGDGLADLARLDLQHLVGATEKTCVLQPRGVSIAGWTATLSSSLDLDLFGRLVSGLPLRQ